MIIALDTNRLTDLHAGVAEVVERVERADEVVLPFIVVAEARAGYRMGVHADRNERRLAAFFAQPGVSVLFADMGTTAAYAELSRELRTAGTPIPVNDVWIAALCIQHRLMLFTRDRHFERVPRLRLA